MELEGQHRIAMLSSSMCLKKSLLLWGIKGRMFHLEMLAPLEISINYNDIAKSVLKFYKLNSSSEKQQDICISFHLEITVITGRQKRVLFWWGFYQLDKKLRVIWQEGISVERMLPLAGPVCESAGHFSITNWCESVQTTVGSATPR